MRSATFLETYKGKGKNESAQSAPAWPDCWNQWVTVSDHLRTWLGLTRHHILFIFQTKLWRGYCGTICVNATQKKLATEMFTFRKTSQVSVKHLYALVRWFFRRVNMKVCPRSAKKNIDMGRIMRLTLSAIFWDIEALGFMSITAHSFNGNTRHSDSEISQMLLFGSWGAAHSERRSENRGQSPFYSTKTSLSPQPNLLKLSRESHSGFWSYMTTVNRSTATNAPLKFCI